MRGRAVVVRLPRHPLGERVDPGTADGRRARSARLRRRPPRRAPPARSGPRAHPRRPPVGVVGGRRLDTGGERSDGDRPPRPERRRGPRRLEGRARSPGPRRTMPRPGQRRARWAASAASMTSVESAGSWTRKAMRRLVLARIDGLTTPEGRCVARIRCTPRLRPRWATSTSDVDEVGHLGDERGELVDHDDEPRQVVGARRPVELGEVGHPGRPQRAARARAARRRASAAPGRRAARRGR